MSSNQSRARQFKRPRVDLSEIQKLPDNALVALPVSIAVTTLSAASIWRAVQAGRLATVKFGPRVTRFRLGDLRALATTGTDRLSEPAATRGGQ